MPFNAPDIGDLILELDADPARTARIRRDNVSNALLRHDWGYRLRTILETLALPAPAPLVDRERKLRALAAETDAIAAETT
jgi:hypothetical protein